MITVKQTHIHKYKKKADLKVTLVAGKQTAVDIIKQRVCSCGKTMAYDLTRELK